MFFNFVNVNLTEQQLFINTMLNTLISYYQQQPPYNSINTITEALLPQEQLQQIALFDFKNEKKKVAVASVLYIPAFKDRTGQFFFS